MAKSRRNLNDRTEGSDELMSNDESVSNSPFNGSTTSLKPASSKRRGRKSLSDIHLQEQVDAQVEREMS
jgi:hypothetical protein